MNPQGFLRGTPPLRYKNSKSQIPNSKQFQNNKLQTQNKIVVPNYCNAYSYEGEGSLRVRLKIKMKKRENRKGEKSQQRGRKKEYVILNM